jgi:hypothetical protein
MTCMKRINQKQLKEILEQSKEVFGKRDQSETLKRLYEKDDLLGEVSVKLGYTESVYKILIEKLEELAQ